MIQATARWDHVNFNPLACQGVLGPYNWSRPPEAPTYVCPAPFRESGLKSAIICGAILDRHAISHMTISKTGYKPKIFFLLTHRVLYHFDWPFGHTSRAPMNWTLEAFHHGSQAAMNAWLGQFICDFAAYLPIQAIFRCKMNILPLVTAKFGLWTLTNSVHEHHVSHPMNTQSKWYSIYRLWYVTDSI